MAIDQNAILHLLMQMSGGGSPQIRPTSGLQEPSLSGLQLGEQGMGLGGGGSLLGGGGGGLGGGLEGGPGLDFFQLMSQLQGAGGAPAPSQNLLGGIGPSQLGFGAGGALQPQQGGVPQGTLGQAGMGGGETAAQTLGILKSLQSVREPLGQLFRRSPGLGFDTTLGTEFGQSLDMLGTPAFSALGGSPGQALAGQVPSTITGTLSPDALSALTGTIPPSLGNVGAQFAAENAGIFGDALGAGGGFVPSAPGAISAPFLAGGGPESVGQLAGAGETASGFGGGGGNFFDVLGPLTGALPGLFNEASRIPTAIGLGLAPFTGGVSAVLGGLFGGLFGGGPSQAWQTFGSRLGGTIGREQAALQSLTQSAQTAQTPLELIRAIQGFQPSLLDVIGPDSPAWQHVGGRFVGGSPNIFDVLDLPGATGTAHEGGITFDPGPALTATRQSINDALTRMGALGIPNIPLPPGADLPSFLAQYGF